MTNLTAEQLANHLLQLKIYVVDNRNITNRCIGRKRLHLSFSGTIQLAINNSILKFFFKSLKCMRVKASET